MKLAVSSSETGKKIEWSRLSYFRGPITKINQSDVSIIAGLPLIVSYFSFHECFVASTKCNEKRINSKL